MKKTILILLSFLLGGVVTFWFLKLRDQQVEEQQQYSYSIDDVADPSLLAAEGYAEPATEAIEDDGDEVDDVWDEYIEWEAKDLSLEEYKDLFWQEMPEIRKEVRDSIAQKYAVMKVIDDYQYKQLADTTLFGGLSALKKFVSSDFKYNGPFNWVYTPTMHSGYDCNRYIVDYDTLTAPIMPVEVRELWVGEKISNEHIFYPIWSYLSQNRLKFNFHHLYKNNKKWVHFLLSKEDYEASMSEDVDLLLRVFDDMDSHPQIMEELAGLMHTHYEMFVSTTNQGGNPMLSEYEGFETYLFPLISKELREEIGSESRIIYLYSFWLRRYYEDKMYETHDLLMEIREDYASM